MGLKPSKVAQAVIKNGFFVCFAAPLVQVWGKSRSSGKHKVAEISGEEYYSTLGWNIVLDDESITWQGRQMWRKTDQVDEGAYYSPIFVDLVDNLNQKNRWGMAYNNDQISDVPHAIINEMAAECTNWSSVKLYLDMYCGIYYTVTQYTNFIEPYEFWFSV